MSRLFFKSTLSLGCSRSKGELEKNGIPTQPLHEMSSETEEEKIQMAFVNADIMKVCLFGMKVFIYLHQLSVCCELLVHYL